MKNKNNGYTFDERIKIREYYNVHPNPSDKNGYDWKMSDIESRTWSALRCIKYCKDFNPEYPVLNYFVDFGDPLKKIAIECDSKKYHFGKYEQDTERQIKIQNKGWKVFRFNSAQIYSEKYEEIIYDEYLNALEEQQEIDLNSGDCMECFLNSTFFSSFYKLNNVFDESGIFYGKSQKEVISETLMEMKTQTLIFRSKL